MTAEQVQLERIAAALGTTPAALIAAAPSLLELAAERFDRRVEKLSNLQSPTHALLNQSHRVHLRPSALNSHRL